MEIAALQTIQCRSDCGSWENLKAKVRYVCQLYIKWRGFACSLNTMLISSNNLCKMIPSYLEGATGVMTSAFHWSFSKIKTALHCILGKETVQTWVTSPFFTIFWIRFSVQDTNILDFSNLHYCKRKQNWITTFAFDSRQLSQSL